MELNPITDLAVDATDLTEELRKLPLLLFRYYQELAEAERLQDVAKAALDEAKAVSYRQNKSDASVKHTEKSLEAAIETDAKVNEARQRYFDARHNALTFRGAVESMKAKKDSLVQLAADRRKEVA